MNKKRQKKPTKIPRVFLHFINFISFPLIYLNYSSAGCEFFLSIYSLEKRASSSQTTRERVSIEMKLNWIVTWDSAQFWLLISWCEWCLPLCYCCCWCWSWCSGYHLNEIVCLSHGNAIITERRCQIFHGQCVLAIFIGLLLLIFRRCMRTGCIAGACFTML